MDNLREAYDDKILPYVVGKNSSGKDIVIDLVNNIGIYLNGNNIEILDEKIKRVLISIFNYSDSKEFEVNIMDSNGSYKDLLGQYENINNYMSSIDTFLISLDDLFDKLNTRKNIVREYGEDNWKGLLRNNPDLLNTLGYSWLTLVVSNYNDVEKEMRKILSKEDFEDYIYKMKEIISFGRAVGIKIVLVDTGNSRLSELFSTIILYNCNGMFKSKLNLLDDRLGDFEEDNSKLILSDEFFGVILLKD